MAEGQLSKFGIIRVTGGTTNMMESGLRLIVTGAEVLGAHDGAVGGADAAVVVKKEEPWDADMQAILTFYFVFSPSFRDEGKWEWECVYQEGGAQGAGVGAAAVVIKKEPRDADMQASCGSLLFIPPLFWAVGQ